LEVVSIGTAACEAGAAVAVGAALAMDSSGRVVTATTLTAALGTLVTVAGAGTVTVGAGGVAGAPTLSGGDLPQFIVGYAMNAATAAGDVIEVFLA
jgi:hypothetical protein